MRVFLLILLLSATTASLCWLSDSRRLAHRARKLAGQVALLGHQLDHSSRVTADLEVEVERMSNQLAESLGIQRAMTENLAQQREQLAAERKSLSSEQRVRRRMMPEGVRQALVDLNDCLQQDGYGEIRFHWATRIVDGDLTGAELLDHRPETLESVLYSCGRLSLELDRPAQTLTLRMFDGSRSKDAEPEKFPEEGETLVLESVDGPMWEARLPFLIEVKGEYSTITEDARSAPLDRVTRASWLERIEDVLSLARTDLRYHLQRYADLQDGHFVGALLLGYDQGHQLAMSAEADSLQVMVDRQANSVSLVLRGGLLRKIGGASDIPSSGYHILLPGVGVDETIAVMLGMVADR